ncbi:MAG: hypothetical protein NT004_04330 [Bacteroidetes bacterium]|nr:hypothetical protein [Bacteroidota bacterium]
MRTIKFSEQELKFMSKLYSDQLAEALNRVEQLQEIIKKLEVKVIEPIEEFVVNERPIIKKRGRKPKEKEEKKFNEHKKRGRKPKVVVPVTIDNFFDSEPVLEVEPVIESLPLPALKKEKKQIEKKKAEGKKAEKKKAPKKYRRPKGMVILTTMSKPLPRKESKVKPTNEIPSANETIVAPSESTPE